MADVLAIAINPGNTITEGDVYATTGTVTGPHAGSLSGTADYGDGTGEYPVLFNGNHFTLQHLYRDNGDYKVIVRVKSVKGVEGMTTTTASVENVSSIIASITVPAEPVTIHKPVSVTASFVDPGIFDNHIASWDWGDGKKTQGKVIESSGRGLITNHYIWRKSGVYPISVAVIDKDGLPVTLKHEFLTTYEDEAPTVFAGSRSFLSPKGAYTKNMEATGEAVFGISVSNDGTPTGAVKINFPFDNLIFTAVSFDSLLTLNGKAILKGKGTLNDAGTYAFVISGLSGEKTGGKDRIRVQLKDETGATLYDTQPGATEEFDPMTPVKGGVVVKGN